MNRLLGGILMAIGILVSSASGLCSAWFLSTMLWTSTNVASGEVGLLTILVLIVGGLPFVGGIGMILAGRSVLRRNRPERYDRDVF